jgi:hypothetical protein
MKPVTRKEELEQKAKEAVELVYERVDRNADLDEHERLIIEQIQRLQQDYEKAVQPWLQRLASLRALRPPQPIVIDGEFLKHHRIIPEETH